MKETLQKRKILLTLDQIRELAKEVKEVGEEMFLLTRKAINVVDGQRFVMQYEGLRASAMETGLGYEYDSDIPYTFWSDVLVQVDKYIRRQEKLQKGQQKGVEQLAELEGLK